MMRLIGSLLFSAALMPMALADGVEDQYNKSCAVCHASGVAGAPRTGDEKAWNERLEAKGMDELVKSVNTGLNAMPPTGMCSDCDDDDMKALIEYMAKAR